SERQAGVVATIKSPLRVFLPTTLPGIREMQDAAFDLPVEKLWQRPGDVLRISRRGELVRDCFDALVFLCLLDHCVDKTGTIRPKNPGNAHHEIPILAYRSQHI